ncbi:MAG: hypothetical protein GEV03_22185 [Streptosporangiales bacterium]|nr:hypothetical protein [Streptosporangiales bacterium]
MKATVFRCGRCGKRYANPLTHVCVVRMDRKRRPGKTRVKPKVTLTCGTCGKPYTNPLTHRCTVRTDYKKRRAAQRHAERRREKAARRKQAAARRRAAAATRKAQAPKTTQPKQQAKRPAPPRLAPTGGSRRANEAHDYRDCFYANKPDRFRAAQDCPAFPCRVYREGHDHGYHDGHTAGHADGYTDGYTAGYAQGLTDTTAQNG